MAKKQVEAEEYAEEGTPVPEPSKEIQPGASSANVVPPSLKGTSQDPARRYKGEV